MIIAIHEREENRFPSYVFASALASMNALSCMKRKTLLAQFMNEGKYKAEDVCINFSSFKDTGANTLVEENIDTILREASVGVPTVNDFKEFAIPMVNISGLFDIFAPSREPLFKEKLLAEGDKTFENFLIGATQFYDDVIIYTDGQSECFTKLVDEKADFSFYLISQADDEREVYAKDHRFVVPDFDTKSQNGAKAIANRFGVKKIYTLRYDTQAMDAAHKGRYLQFITSHRSEKEESAFYQYFKDIKEIVSSFNKKSADEDYDESKDLFLIEYENGHRAYDRIDKPYNPLLKIKKESAEEIKKTYGVFRKKTEKVVKNRYSQEKREAVTIIDETESYNADVVLDEEEKTPVRPVIEQKKKSFEMPFVAGYDKDEAVEILRETFDNISVKLAFSDSDDDTGKVISQNIKPGKEIGRKEAIILTVSKGMERFLMPSLIGLSKEELKDAEKQYCITITSTEMVYDCTETTNKTVWQSVAEGTQYTKGTAVTVKISLGAQPYDAAEVADAILDSCYASLEKSGEFFATFKSLLIMLVSNAAESDDDCANVTKKMIEKALVGVTAESYVDLAVTEGGKKALSDYEDSVSMKGNREMVKLLFVIPEYMEDNSLESLLPLADRLGHRSEMTEDIPLDDEVEEVEETPSEEIEEEAKPKKGLRTFLRRKDK